MPWDPGLLQDQRTEGEAFKRTRDVYPRPGADLAPTPQEELQRGSQGTRGVGDSGGPGRAGAAVTPVQEGSQGKFPQPMHLL